MNDITALAQREKFEAWLEEAEALPWGYLKKRRTSDDAYHEPNTTDMWGAWQAASAEMVEALERAASEPVAWVRYCSDGTFDGPLMNYQIEDCRKSTWTPLYTVPPALESRTVTAPQSDYFASLVAMARVSADKAMRKFPQPNYVLLKVAEEAGEVVQAGVHYAEKRMEWGQVEGEIVQLLAMLIRLVTEGDQINGVTPPAAGIQVIEGEGQ
ncbi:TPA: hypothetical protein ACJ2XA_004255 [Kluyvera georgiana]